MAKTSLLEALKTVTADDLAMIDDQIGKLQTELDGLRAARGLINIRLNGRPQRKKPVRRTAAPPPALEDAHKSVAEQTYELLDEEGSMPIPAIAARIGRSE